MNNKIVKQCSCPFILENQEPRGPDRMWFLICNSKGSVSVDAQSNLPEESHGIGMAIK